LKHGEETKFYHEHFFQGKLEQFVGKKKWMEVSLSLLVIDVILTLSVTLVDFLK